MFILYSDCSSVCVYTLKWILLIDNKGDNVQRFLIIWIIISYMYTCISIWFIPWSPKLYSHCTICTNVKLTIFIHDINQELKQFQCYLTYVIFHLYRELNWWARTVRIKHLNADLLCFGNTTHFEAGSVDPTTVAFPMKSD